MAQTEQGHTRDWTSNRAIKTIEMLTGRQAEIPAASADAKALSLSLWPSKAAYGNHSTDG